MNKRRCFIRIIRKNGRNKNVKDEIIETSKLFKAQQVLSFQISKFFAIFAIRIL